MAMLVRTNPESSSFTPKRGGLRCGWGRGWQVVLALWLAAAGVWGAERLKQFDVFLGYDGITPDGRWFPITLEMLNEGPALRGTIEIESQHFNRAIVQRVAIELPTGTRKRVCIPVYGAGYGFSTWDVVLRDANGAVRDAQRQLQPRQSVRGWSMIVAGLPRSVSGMPVLAEVNNRFRDRQPVTARLTAELFPDHPLALEGMAALYLNAEKAGELREGQVRALSAWLHQGGHLVVGLHTPSDLQTCPWLREWLPFTVNGMEELDCAGALDGWTRQPHQRMWTALYGRTNVQPGFIEVKDHPAFLKQPCPVVTGQIREGRVLLAHQQRPLVVSAGRGRGVVTVLTFSPEMEPFRSWTERKYFWSKLLEVPPAYHVRDISMNTSMRIRPEHPEHFNHYYDGLFGVMNDSRQIRKLPVGWLLVLLLSYLAVIGPVDYWVLRRLKRPMLTWITFPAYVGLFSLLIYWVGYRMRAGDVEWNEFHVVDVHARSAGQAQCRGRGFVSIYSPINAQYPVASPAGFASLREEYFMYLNRSFKNPLRTVVVQRGDAFEGALAVPVWSSQMFVEEYWQPGQAAPLEATVTRRGDAGEVLEVTVRNLLAKPLGAVMVVAEGKVVEGEAVPARGQKTLHITDGRAMADYLQPNNDSMIQAVGARRSLVQEIPVQFKQPEDWLRWTAAASFLEAFPGKSSGGRFLTDPYFDLSACAERSLVVVLAMVPDHLPKPALHGPSVKPQRSQRHTVYRLVLPPLPAGPAQPASAGP